MNSVAEISALVVRRFNRLYGPPTTPDRDAYFAEYYKALAGTDPKILEEAIDALVKRIEIPAWPTPGACVEAVNRVAERRMSERRQQQVTPHKDDYREPTPEERARVKELLGGLTAKLTNADREHATHPRADWDRGTKPAWDERLATSEVAKQLSIPRNLRGR